MSGEYPLCTRCGQDGGEGFGTDPQSGIRWHNCTGLTERSTWEERMAVRAAERAAAEAQARQAIEDAERREWEAAQYAARAAEKDEPHCPECWEWREPTGTVDHMGRLVFGWRHRVPEWWRPTTAELQRLVLTCEHDCHRTEPGWDVQGAYYVEGPPIGIAGVV